MLHINEDGGSEGLLCYSPYAFFIIWVVYLSSICYFARKDFVSKFISNGSVPLFDCLFGGNVFLKGCLCPMFL